LPDCFSGICSGKQLTVQKDILIFLYFVSLAVAAGRARVQQDPLVETTEGTQITINCSHPDIQSSEYIYWYRQLPGRGPELLGNVLKGSKELPDKAAKLSVSPDRRWSSLCLSRPRLKDAAVYSCALAGTARAAGAAAGHEPPRRGRAGPGAQRRPGPAGAAPAPPRALSSRMARLPGPPSFKGLLSQGLSESTQVQGRALLDAPPYFTKCAKLEHFMVAVPHMALDQHISPQPCSVCKQQGWVLSKLPTIRKTKIPPMTPVFMPEQMQEIGYKSVVAAKRKFHPSQGMRCTCYPILSPRLAANSSAQTL
ncbi:uncharacterized protein LOC126653172, partial [Myiozetetes cayanensis]|uniref:uncharacterized protein LOC126653172 n=1 Tax=Myiozetetes cayanensis TaxID=478635 RepID=UPI002160F131